MASPVIRLSNATVAASGKSEKTRRTSPFCKVTVLPAGLVCTVAGNGDGSISQSAADVVPGHNKSAAIIPMTGSRRASNGCFDLSPGERILP